MWRVSGGVVQRREDHAGAAVGDLVSCETPDDFVDGVLKV